MAMSLDEVDLILQHRFADNVCEYLVQWSGDLARTWEPSVNLTECQTLLSSYWREFSTTARNFEFLTPSFTLVEEQVSEDEGEEGDEVEAEPKPAAKKRMVAAKRRPAQPAEDKIAVAKRVQSSKQLVGARSRAGQAASSSTRPPPPTAKRSVAMEYDDDFDTTEPPAAPAAGPVRRSSSRPGRQVARKSTGGRRPPPPSN